MCPKVVDIQVTEWVIVKNKFSNGENTGMYFLSYIIMVISICIHIFILGERYFGEGGGDFFHIIVEGG